MKSAYVVILLLLLVSFAHAQDQGQSSMPVTSLPLALFFSVPYVGANPYRVIMLDGPLTSAKEDARELREKMKIQAKSSLQRSCETMLLAVIEATRDENFGSAEEFGRKILTEKCDPWNQAFAGYYLGTIFENQAQYGEALKVLLVARANFTRSESQHRYRFYCDATLGRVYFYLNFQKEALTYLAEVLHKFPQDLPHNFLAGVAAGKLGFREREIEFLKMVLDRAPQTPNSLPLVKETLYMLGIAYFEKKEFRLARACAEQGLKLEPQSPRFTQLLKQIDSLTRESVRSSERRKLFGVF